MRFNLILYKVVLSRGKLALNSGHISERIETFVEGFAIYMWYIYLAVSPNVLICPNKVRTQLLCDILVNEKENLQYFVLIKETSTTMECTQYQWHALI